MSIFSIKKEDTCDSLAAEAGQIAQRFAAVQERELNRARECDDVIRAATEDKAVAVAEASRAGRVIERFKEFFS